MIITMIYLISLALFAWEIDFSSLQQVGVIFAGIIGALWLWKSGLPQQLFSSANSLIEIRTIERDDALKKVAKLEVEMDMMKKHQDFLNSEIKQRTEIWFLDQAEIRALREKK